MAAEPAIEAHRLVRRFGARIAVSNIDLSVGAGEFLTIFGPNGAGKTTLLRVLCGLLKPSKGDVRLLGTSISKDPVEAKRRIGFIGHASFLYGGLTAAENLAFYARLYGVADARKRIESLLREVGLWDRAAEPIRSFSRGMLQRLTIARALLHDPELIFLDEPFTGLDREAVRTLKRLLETVRQRGRTVLMVTHHTDEGLELASRVILMSRGEIVDDRGAAGLTGEALEGIYASMVASWSS
jgi:heme exporter protein A